MGSGPRSNGFSMATIYMIIDEHKMSPHYTTQAPHLCNILIQEFKKKEKTKKREIDFLKRNFLNENNLKKKVYSGTDIRHFYFQRNVDLRYSRKRFLTPIAVPLGHWRKRFFAA